VTLTSDVNTTELTDNTTRMSTVDTTVQLTFRQTDFSFKYQK